MSSFIDYNEQLLKYKEAAKEGFIDVNEDPKKSIDPITITLPNKDGIDLEAKNFIEHEKTTNTTPTTDNSGDGIDLGTHSVDDYTDEEIVTRTITNEAGEEVVEEVTIGPARAKLRATLDAPNYSTLKSGIDLVTHSVDDLTDEAIVPASVDENGEPVPEQIGPGREKLRNTIMVPNESPNLSSTEETANKINPAQQIYQPVGAGFKGVADIVVRATTPLATFENTYEEITSDDLMEYKEREENSITGNNMQMFLYSLVPYVLGQAAEGINALQREIAKVGESGGQSLFAQLGTLKSVLFTASYLSYFNLRELGFSLAQTPFTLGYLASFGLALKDESNSIKWNKVNVLKFEFNAKSWDITEIKDNIKSSKSGPTLKEQYAAIYKGIFKELTETNLNDYISKLFGGETEAQAPSTFLAEYQSLLDEEFRTKMHEIINKFNDTYRYSKSLFEFGTGVIPIGSKNKDGNLAVFFNGDKSHTTEKTQETHLIKPGSIGVPNTLLGSYKKILESEAFQAMAQNIYSYKPGEEYSKETTRTQVIFDDTKKMIAESESFTDKIKENLKSQAQLGYIYVYPTITDQENGAKKFKIPFQFNPVLGESGQGARYDAMNMLHRQGQAFSYVQTEGQTLTLETEYIMLSDGDEAKNGHDPANYLNPQDSFYSFWTPKTIQAVELALRSLVLPTAQNEIGKDIIFHKPPMVKIVMGGNETDATDKNNLYQMLTYPLKNEKFYHKTYIVTKVMITKDVETPYYIKDNKVIDKHGFKVNIDLTEIDHNYIGAAPDFMNYYRMYSVSEDSYIGETKVAGGQ